MLSFPRGCSTFTNFEVIVVDDGSPDTAELKAALEPFRSRVRYIEQPNRSAGAARNAGIRAAHGRFVAFLDADDRWTPEFLAHQVAYLEANRVCALVRDVLAERRARASGLSGDAVAEIGRALNVLDRFGRAHALEGVARTALRIRMMALVDRLEIEQAKQRLVEGNYAAARYHLSASRERGLKRRLALMALQVAPRMIRSAYLWLRHRS